ncbi:MAG: hypothetical protein ACD_12C00500G0002 [uncultured bacterium]|nr:MAG: hypothetical protein ACD_12C00500G0002 [uncultured bacterium]
MNKRTLITVWGEVQGVNFRVMVKMKAEKLNLKGWVANLGNGAVKIEAEGKDYALDKLIDWINSSPGLSIVADIKIEWLVYKNIFENFAIKY